MKRLSTARFFTAVVFVVMVCGMATEVFGQSSRIYGRRSSIGEAVSPPVVYEGREIGTIKIYDSNRRTWGTNVRRISYYLPGVWDYGYGWSRYPHYLRPARPIVCPPWRPGHVATPYRYGGGFSVSTPYVFFGTW